MTRKFLIFQIFAGFVDASRPLSFRRIAHQRERHTDVAGDGGRWHHRSVPAANRRWFGSPLNLRLKVEGWRMFDDVRVRWNPKLHKTKLLSILPSSPSTGASLFGLILKIKKHENNLTKMIRKHTKKYQSGAPRAAILITDKVWGSSPPSSSHAPSNPAYNQFNFMETWKDLRELIIFFTNLRFNVISL